LSRLDTAGPAASASHGHDRSKLLWAGGTVFDLVLDGAQTGGSVALLDQTGRHGDTTPLHIHHNEAEIFYVLAGEVVAWAGDDVYPLAAGGAVYLPPGQVHAFGIRSEQARLLSVTSPAGFANFVRSVGIPVTGDVPATWEFDLGTMIAAEPQYGLEIVGPPPALPAS
jgi:quercetin dioxygenase-like cupin family protein